MTEKLVRDKFLSGVFLKEPDGRVYVRSVESELDRYIFKSPDPDYPRSRNKL
jgi:hypothetical protein